MKTIIAIIQPFQLKQKVYILVGANVIRFYSFALNDLPQRIVELAHKERAWMIKLDGSVDYNKYLKTKIKVIDDRITVIL